jgi:uncharacterized membrane protein YhaH (DUF805 family)
MGDNLGKLLFSFYGRINRAKYWLANFVGIVFWAVLLLLAWIAPPRTFRTETSDRICVV